MATRTQQSKPKLLYSLPLQPPIPFPRDPTYPVVLPTRSLREAYLDTLWPKADSGQTEQSLLEAFARQLLTLLAARSPSELNALARELIIPLQKFDKRWRTQLPPLVEESDDSIEGDTASMPNRVDEDEARRVRSDYDRWAVEEKVRLQKRLEEQSKKIKGKQRATDQDAPEHDEEPVAGTDAAEVRPNKWLADKELLETRLQTLLLLALLSLPATFQPDLPRKGRKKKNPEHFAETLDPTLLLDFLTDRMQIWRVMQDVSDLASAADVPLSQKEATVAGFPIEERDEVQLWWADVVEPLFRTKVDAAILSHHRVKLFPAATSQAERLTQRHEPAPSPFKARTLLSLEKSARRRELREGERRVAESPTMKRLMSMSSLTGRAKERITTSAGDNMGTSSKTLRQGEHHDVFKVPVKQASPPQHGTNTLDEPTVASVADAPKATATRQRLPRKQERPRPLPRGDSMSTGIRESLQRRVVSLSKKPGMRKKHVGDPPRAEDEDEPRRKRKSLSPKKLNTSDRAALALTLVPNTPDKASVSSASAVSFRNPFSRTDAVPSLAALGAAFRAGPTDGQPLSLRLPTPPQLPLDSMHRQGDKTTDGAEDSEDSDESMILGDCAGALRGSAGAQVDMSRSTPKKQIARQVLVPDT